ncbi:glycosyltransferase [Paenibacillus sp. DMB20]|uniref:glycosyltransferase n=1 Tax=Paenibacillus sp. DMB20 TaxID=1642570 RepID=UPI001364D407|nr:glycosyltransferase [Paenibacillus sp. DMB20]
MPDADHISEVLQTVKQLKPLFVLSVSGSNVTADLLSNIVPVVTLSLSYDLPISKSTFSILPKKLEESDLETLNVFDIDKESIIESVFTYKYDPPRSKLARSEFGFDNSNFIIAVVGNRLDLELTDEFLFELEELVKSKDHVRILFIGDYDNYNEHMDSYSSLKKRSIFIGFQPDLAAVFEVCDAYLNPFRAGGGTSAAIALKQGLPIFTYAYGDVAYTAGESFHITSFNDIKKFVDDWNDLVFRENARICALNRADEIFNSQKKLKDIMNKMSQSHYFFMR